jgi:hypothetical protein
VVGVSLDGGGYSATSRGSLAIAVWWLLLLGTALGLLSARGVSRRTTTALLSFVGLALLTGASSAWAASAEKAVVELDRTLLYLGIFTLVTLAASRADADRWSDGLAVGVVVVACVAVGDRLFGLLDDDGMSTYLPNATERLSEPVGYWNGLGVLAALGVPFLLRAAVGARSELGRMAGLVPVPVVAATVYLTSSRGAAAACVVAVGVFVALEGPTWRGVGTTLLAGGAAAAGVAVAASNRGAWSTVLLLTAAGGVAAVTLTAASRSRWSVPRPRLVAVAFAALCSAAVLAAAAAANPAERFEEFRQPPTAEQLARTQTTAEHLLSANGAGRWQFWSAALEASRAHPLGGLGGGGYEAWWAQHGTLPTFVRSAHSLFLETLAELGPLGLALLAVTLAAALAAGVGAARGGRGASAVAAAACASAAAWIVAASVDWIWDLPAVSVVGIGALALGGAAGRSTDVPHDLRSTLAPRLAVVAAAVAAIALLAQPLLAQAALEQSRGSARAGDLAEAESRARAARAIQPWASTPFVQLALVQEERGRTAAAARSIRSALARDDEDWRLWLIAARIDAAAGAPASARRSFCRAAELNPRSPLFDRGRASDASTSPTHGRSCP